MFKKEDGSEFPADQVFDVMIVGGGGNAGTLLSSTGSGPVLTGTLAPVRYVAPAAIDGDSLIVQVAAFAYGSGGATLSVAQAKAMPLLKKVPGEAATQASSNKAKGSVMVALGKLLAESVCEAGQAVVVKKKRCDNAPPCPPEQFNPPDFVVKPQPNGFAGNTICQGADDLGAFKPLTGANAFKPFSVDPCFDRDRDRWRFSIVSPMEINAVLDLCYSNIANKRQNLITSIDQIPADCRALDDFKGHYTYPVRVREPFGYLIQEVLMAHELQHKADYDVLAYGLRNEFNKAIEEYQSRLPCVAFDNVSDAKTNGTLAINKFFQGFLNVVLDKWSEMVGKDRNDPRRKLYEQDTHARSLRQGFIEAYTQELKQKYHCQ